jgi:hypothetical protein
MNIKNVILCLVFACVGSALVIAQDSSTSEKGKAETRTITGCLVKGDSADEFVLNAKNGSTWDVNSDAVALADHVGHMVSITGVVENSTMHNMKEDAKDAAAATGMKKDNREHGSLKATNVKMVSDSCSK